ncbi:protein of unknown function [Shewanella benthica]|uniref:Uncharacterized protein n=1 Tax=Shewanella benthica TaxID=43661 RepID=A0A330M291_9GAMM|nr:protein of unknown function [Shewanella benthica]
MRIISILVQAKQNSYNHYYRQLKQSIKPNHFG